MRHPILFYCSTAATCTVKTVQNSGRMDAGMWVMSGKFLHRSATHPMPTGQKEIRKKKLNKPTRLNSWQKSHPKASALGQILEVCPWSFFSVAGLHPIKPMCIALSGTQGQVHQT